MPCIMTKYQSSPINCPLLLLFTNRNGAESCHHVSNEQYFSIEGAGRIIISHSHYTRQSLNSNNSHCITHDDSSDRFYMLQLLFCPFFFFLHFTAILNVLNIDLILKSQLTRTVFSNVTCPSLKMGKRTDNLLNKCQRN